MDALRRLSLDHRRLFLAMVAVALAVRALVPGGWMVTPARDGALRLALCSGTAPTEIAAATVHAMASMPAMHHHGDGKSTPSHADHPCAFSGVGLASGLPTLDVPAPPTPAIERAARGHALSVAVGHGLAAPPPPPTGPPAFV